MSETIYRLTKQNIGDYIKQVLNILPPGADFMVSEIGDGNINYVYRVQNLQDDTSFIIKQSDALLRSSGRPLSVDRSRIEVEMLRLQDKFSPGFVPKVLAYDKYLNVIVMEDISDHENLRYALLAGKIFPSLSDHMSTFIVETTLPTTDLVMDRKEKKENVIRFTNPDMCDITEDLVLSEPYTDYKKRNVITRENMDFVNREIYSDKDLIFEAGKLRHDFMNKPQALIHGDLHTGSIFVRMNSTKVIDPEFAFYGPIGYDLGNVIAHLIFAWGNAVFTRDTEKEKHFIKWIQETIAETIHLFQTKFLNLYRKSVTDSMAKNEAFMNWYLESILSDAAGYAGMELIRRIIGDAKVQDLTSVEELNAKLQMEQELLLIGKKLVKERTYIKEGKNITDLLQSML